MFQTAISPANTLTEHADKILQKTEHREEAIKAIAGAKTREEAVRNLPPHLEYLRDTVKVFLGAISTEGHVKALAAIQPHLSHSISKTCNMDAHSSVADISRAYLMAYNMGVKCVAVYRDGSKKAQPLKAGTDFGVTEVSRKEAVATTKSMNHKWTPDKWPAVKRPTPHHSSNCDLFHFRIADPTTS